MIGSDGFACPNTRPTPENPQPGADRRRRELRHRLGGRADVWRHCPSNAGPQDRQPSCRDCSQRGGRRTQHFSGHRSVLREAPPSGRYDGGRSKGLPIICRSAISNRDRGKIRVTRFGAESDRSGAPVMAHATFLKAQAVIPQLPNCANRVHANSRGTSQPGSKPPRPPPKPASFAVSSSHTDIVRV